MWKNTFIRLFYAISSKRIVLGFTVLLFICPISFAQKAEPVKDSTDIQITPTPAGSEISITTETIEAKRKDFAAQLDVAKQNIANASVDNSTDIIDCQNKIIELLGKFDNMLNQQMGMLKQIDSNKASEDQLKSQLAQLQTNGPAEKPPYSFLLLDNLRGQLVAEQEKGSSLDSTMKTFQGNMDELRNRLQDKNNARILAKDTLDKNQDTAAIPLLALRHRLAQLDCQYFEEIANLIRLRIQNQKIAQSIYTIQLDVLKERIKWIEKDNVFSQADLQIQLQSMDSAIVELENRKKKADDNLNLAQKSYESAQDRLAKSTEQTAVLLEEERARRYERDYYQQEVDILPQRVTRTKDRRLIWQRRYDVINDNATIEQLDAWLAESNNRLTVLDTNKAFFNSILNEVRKDLGALTEKSEQLKEEKSVTDKLNAQKKFLQDRINLVEDNIARIESLQRFYNTLIDEIKKKTQTWTWGDLLQYTHLKYDKFMNYSVWSSEIQKQEATEYTLTVRKIAAALAYLIFGVLFARLLSRYGVRFVMNRLGAHEGASAALQSLTYYFLLIVVIVMTFKAFSIPLTAFAFLGGALAIGIGFGSQNILNNFISGIILLVERPIRVGDLIEVDGVGGTVASIGPRCTRFITFTNIDYWIPNSKLLENKVINLTFIDKVIRTTVSVGVAYGSDLRKVFQLIKKAVDDHGLINKHPEPFVTLTDFGDNALLFEVRFWITLSGKVNRLIVESDVRHRICHLFEEGGITIAYPQRDVHLDIQRPLDIRLLPNSKDDHPDNS